MNAEKGVIKLAYAEWASPVILVQMKGDTRMWFLYRLSKTNRHYVQGFVYDT